MDVISKGEHVSIAENAILNMKGRVRGVIAGRTMFPYELDVFMLVWITLWI